MKKFICGVLALALLLAAVCIMYPELLYRFVEKEKVDELISPAHVELGEEKMGLGSFPLYGNASFYGISSVLEDCADYIDGSQTMAPDVWSKLGRVAENENFLKALFSFAVLSLLSIPVYMILRLIPYNTLYHALEDSGAVGKVVGRGALALSSGITTVSITWFLYNSVLVDRALTQLLNLKDNVKVPEVALNVTNVVLIVVAILAVIGLLKTTLFRGSVFTSVMLSLLRTLLFIAAFAFVNVFSGRMTWKLIVIALLAIPAVGIIKGLVEPEE